MGRRKAEDDLPGFFYGSWPGGRRLCKVPPVQSQVMPPAAMVGLNSTTFIAQQKSDSLGVLAVSPHWIFDSELTKRIPGNL